MADIDDELLALAGDASSEEEDDAPMNISQDSSADEKPASKAKSRKAVSRKPSRKRDDSEEEGEASSDHSSPVSLKSAPMDESDSESDPSPAPFEDGDKYPLEGKFMSAADKAEIMAMPEIKREELLAERAQEVERDRQNSALRRLLHAREAESGKAEQKKRKAGAADLDENQRKTSRQRTKLGGGKVGEASSGIETLKRARAEKSDRQRRREEDKERNKGRKEVLEEYSDADAEGDEEVEWDDGKSKNKKAHSPDYRDAEPAGLQDIERVRVGRTRFALVCFYPGFEEAILGCYVRINIGAEKGTGQNLYRMAIIKGFTTDRPYAVETANGKHFKTTQYIRAAHGKAERNWPFITCSDSPFTEAEWNRYKATCQAEGIPLPTKPKLLQKIADINALVNRSWTEAELQEKLTKSGALVNKYIPIKRNQITNAIKEAKSQGDEAKVAELQIELEALNGGKLAFGSSMQPSPKKVTTPQGLSQQERLAVLNKQNRRKNAEEVRQAQINERRAAKMTEAAIARGEIVPEDHSRRLKTRAKFKHDVTDGFGIKKTDSERSGTSTPVPGSGTSDLKAKKLASPLPHLAKLHKESSGDKAGNGKSGLPTIRRPLMDDDIIGAIDLGIELEL